MSVRLELGAMSNYQVLLSTNLTFTISILLMKICIKTLSQKTKTSKSTKLLFLLHYTLFFLVTLKMEYYTC